MHKIQISPHGVLYSVNPDNTITRYGRVDSDGKFIPADGTSVPSAANLSVPMRRRPVWGYRLIIILLLMVCGLFYYMYDKQQEQIVELQSRIRQAETKAGADAGALARKQQLVEKLNKELENVNRSRFEAENTLSQISANLKSIAPLAVTSVEFRNINSSGRPLGNWGAPLTASSTRFVQARVSYYGLLTGMRKFNVRIIGPDGPMGNGEYSFSVSRPVEEGSCHSFDVSGFGYADHGWPPGKYSYQIWYGKSMIAGVHFVIMD